MHGVVYTPAGRCPPGFDRAAAATGDCAWRIRLRCCQVGYLSCCCWRWSRHSCCSGNSVPGALFFALLQTASKQLRRWSTWNNNMPACQQRAELHAIHLMSCTALYDSVPTTSLPAKGQAKLSFGRHRNRQRDAESKGRTEGGVAQPRGFGIHGWPQQQRLASDRVCQHPAQHTTAQQAK